MHTERYRYRFNDTLAIEEIESCLVLALLATESLHGESQTRLDAGHYLDPDRRVCVAEADSNAGRDFNRLFVGFLRRECGEHSFTVEPANSEAATAAA